MFSSSLSLFILSSVCIFHHIHYIWQLHVSLKLFLCDKVYTVIIIPDVDDDLVETALKGKQCLIHLLSGIIVALDRSEEVQVQ